MPPQMAGGRGAPQMAGGRGAPIMPPSQPGGEGQGIRTPSTPARPQARSSPGAGSPVSSVQQRGMPPTVQQQNSNAMMGARRPRGQ